MKKLTVIVITFLICQVSVFANATQTFVSNTMHIDLDNDTKYEKVFIGTKEEFTKQAKEVLSQDTVKNAAMASVLSVGAVGASRGTFKDISKGGGLIGVVAIATITAGMAAYNYIVSDHEYLYVSIATKKY